MSSRSTKRCETSESDLQRGWLAGLRLSEAAERQLPQFHTHGSYQSSSFCSVPFWTVVPCSLGPGVCTRRHCTYQRLGMRALGDRMACWSPLYRNTFQPLGLAGRGI